MRKFIIKIILTVMMTLLISSTVFAAIYEGEEGLIEITGGVDMNKEYESTFDESRTISGRAESGTLIIIDVCEVDEDNELYVVDSYEYEVGRSGYFSTRVYLYEGGNIIVISDEDSNAVIVAQINRKNVKIKSMLENVRCVPGGSIITGITF